MGFNHEDNDNVKLKGMRNGVDREINSVNDGEIERLAVDAKVNVQTTVPATSSGLVYDDMAEISRGTSVSTTWTDIYDYSGSGYLYGLLLNLSSINVAGWAIRLLVDGNDIFIGANGITTADLVSQSAYNLDYPITGTSEQGIRLAMGQSHFSWSSPLNYPIRYTSSVVMKVKRTTSPDKEFNAGFMVLTKE